MAYDEGMKLKTAAKFKAPRKPTFDVGDVVVYYRAYALYWDKLDADVALLPADAMLTLSLHGTLFYSQLGTDYHPKIGDSIETHELVYSGYERQDLMRAGEFNEWRGRLELCFPKSLQNRAKGSDESKPYAWHGALGCNGLIVHPLMMDGGRRGLQKGETPVVIFSRE